MHYCARVRPKAQLCPKVNEENCILDRKNRGETSMKKNRIRPITNGRSLRMSYSKQKEVLEMPNLIEVQRDSYQWFLDEGLKEVFDDISPIVDYSGKLSLEFVDFTLCEDDVKYSIEECKERDATTLHL